MKQALFYIESPFQLLQVYEAIKYFGIHDYCLMIRVNDSTRNNEQVKNLVKLLKLNKPNYYKCHSNIRCLFLSLKLWVSSLRVKRVFIGDENSKVFRVVQKLLSLKKTVLLDDGVASINRAANHEEYKQFSIFSQGENVIQNEFSALAEFVKGDEASDLDTVNLIIGSKLVDVNICSQKTYFEALKMMLGMCDTEVSTAYIAHRDESEQYLEQIKNNFDIKVIKPELPIELIAKELNIRVNTVFTTISTALFSMERVYPDAKFKIFRIADDNLIERKEAVENLYNFIENQNIDTATVVKLPKNMEKLKADEI